MKELGDKTRAGRGSEEVYGSEDGTASDEHSDAIGKATDKRSKDLQMKFSSFSDPPRSPKRVGKTDQTNTSQRNGIFAPKTI